MTPDSALEPIEQPKTQAPSTAGMTTKVVKGSIWTLGGSVLPLAVSFVATPFIIRFLGSEAYGVLLLVGLIPTYFSFADFGMGIASTKFASEAYGEGDPAKEADVVWTATTIALVTSLILAIPIFIFSFQIVTALNVPEHLLSQASIALKITAATFVLGILGSVVNSPILSRLRMDLGMITVTVPRIILAAVTPFIFYFGGGIVEAVSWVFIVGVATLAVVVYISARLLPGLFSGRVDRRMVRPLLKFGGAWFVAMVAAILLVNLEKLFLTKMVSVQALAYYSVAFTFANMATMFSQAMIQSLIPAFSQLLTPERRGHFDALFATSIRLNLIWLLPVVMLMFILAKPFFMIMGGEEFVLGSTSPLHILLVGLFFNILAYIPHTSITASGRTDVLAKLYWFELIFYSLTAFLLIWQFGIQGAAAAWSIRVVLDSFVVTILAKKVTGITFRYTDYLFKILIGCIVLLPPIVLMLVFDLPVLPAVGVAGLCVTVYFYFVWKWFLEEDERRWLVGRAQNFIRL